MEDQPTQWARDKIILPYAALAAGCVQISAIRQWDPQSRQLRNIHRKNNLHTQDSDDQHSKRRRNSNSAPEQRGVFLLLRTKHIYDLSKTG